MSHLSKTGMILAAALALLVGGAVLAQPRGGGPGGSGGPHGMLERGPGGGPGHGPGRGGPAGGLVRMMLGHLDLSAEQREQVRATVREHLDGGLAEQVRAHHEQRRELDRLVRDPGATQEALVEAARRLGQSGEQLALSHHALVTGLFGILSEEQRQQLDEVLARREQRMQERLERRRERYEEGPALIGPAG